MTTQSSKYIASYQLHTVQYMIAYTCTHWVRAYACKPEPTTHSMSTIHQARWVGELTGETRHSLMTHLLMLITRLTRLTYQMALPLFLQRRETMTKIQLVVYPVMGGRDTHYHKDTLHPTHQNFPIKLTQSCQL